jgi:hypothetical protein
MVGANRRSPPNFNLVPYVILAGGLASDFTMGELGAYIFPRGLALPRYGGPEG